MKRVDMYQTSDGVLHDRCSRASHHAEERYGALLCKLAAQAVRAEKYTAMMEFIAAHLDEFCTLKALKQDIELEPEED